MTYDPTGGQLNVLAIAEALINADAAAAKALIPADTSDLTNLVVTAAGMLADSIRTTAGHDNRSHAEVITELRAWIISEGNTR